jgi:outer membrane protein
LIWVNSAVGSRRSPVPVALKARSEVAAAILPTAQGEIMKHVLFAASLLTAAAFSVPAFAQSPTDTGEPLVGKQANSFMVRARAISVTPLDATSDISAIGGHVNTTVQFAPEVDLSYFLTDNIAFELIAATTRHNVSSEGTALGKVDVGSVWALPPRH